jgi:polyhydroxybutyrate depolymerase
MRTNRLLPTLAVLALAVAALAAQRAAAAPSPTVMKWTIDGVERQGLVFAPSATMRPGMGTIAKRPLVFAFHGHGGTARGASLSMRLQARWPEAIVIYLQGLPTVSPVDPHGRRPGWQRTVGENGDRDLKLVDAALASLREQFPVDDHRIYATGFSNGAFFTYLLWAARGKTFAAFAPCAGLLGADLHPAEPRPVLAIGGENDPLVTFDRWKQTLATVRELDGATADGAACGSGCTRYPSAKNAPVEAITHPGGHVYPPWASEKIVTFLKGLEPTL